MTISTIVTTIEILKNLGFLCNNEKKLTNFINLVGVNSISMKHKDYMVFAHLSSNTNNEVPAFLLMISNSSSTISDSNFRYAKVSTAFSTLKNKVNKFINEAHKTSVELVTNETRIASRLPIVTKELTSIFGDCAVTSSGKDSFYVVVNYKDVDLAFTTYATEKKVDLDFYTTSLLMSGVSNLQINAKQAKSIIDLIK